MPAKTRILFRKIWFREGWSEPVEPGYLETLDPGFLAEIQGRIQGNAPPFRVQADLLGAPAARPEDLGVDPALAGAKAARRRWIGSFVARQRLGDSPDTAQELPVEINFPCVDRRAGSDWRNELRPARVTEDGAIYLQDPGMHQARANVALAALFRRGESDVPVYSRFSDLRTMSQESALYQLEPILSRYGLGDGWSQWLRERPGRQFDVSILLRLGSGAARAWADVPGPGQSAFHERLIEVANGIQGAIRAWLSYGFFQDLSVYRTPARAWPVLVYAAMKPFRGRSRADFCYEVTDPASIQRALWGVLPALEDEMRRIAPRLANLPQQLQYAYSQRRTPEMAKEAANLPRIFGGLLFGEREIVEAFLRFAQRLHETIPAGKTGGLFRHGSLLYGKVSRKLAALCTGADYSNLAPMVLLEATAALAAASGYPTPIEALVRIRDRQEGADYYSANCSFTG